MATMKPLDDQDYMEITSLNNDPVNMQRELAKRNVELERLKANLETLVAERTAALVNINNQLSTELIERKQAERALRESEEIFRSVISQSNDGIRLINAEGNICEWNLAMETITGLNRQDVMGKPFVEVCTLNFPIELRTPDRIEQFKKRFQAYLESEPPLSPFPNSVYAIEHVDGSRRLLQTVVSRINTLRGPMLCGVVRDVTELKQREKELEFAHLELAQSYDLTLEGWSRTLDIRERETAGHSKRVVELACRLAQKAGMDDKDVIPLRRGALLHDIGKIGIPDKLLLKPGALDEDEWTVMKQHPEYALRLLQDIPYLQPALDIPYCHHERWDGTGYPRGLKGEEIPFSARIFALADVYDALTSDRPYRKAWEHDQTLKYFHEQAGRHFDPHLVGIFLDVMKKDETGQE